MKKIILIITLLVSAYSFAQNRYSQSTPSSYSPMTLSEIMTVPQNLSNKYNQNQKYLYSLKNWILELKPQITQQSYMERLNKEYKDLELIEDKDLSKATQYLQQTENAIKEIISDYNIYVANNSNNSSNSTSNTSSNSNFFEQGIQYYNKQEYAKSIISFSKFLENDKNNTDAMFYRALVKSELNDNYGAIADYDKIIELNSNYPIQVAKLATVYNNKAYSLVKLKKYSEALPLVQKALSLDKTEWYIWDTRGEIYFNLGNYESCIYDLTQAINIKGDQNSYYLRGLANIKLGRKEAGCKDLSKAGELGNENAYEKISSNCK